MKTNNFPTIESYPLTNHMRAEDRRKTILQFMSFVRACIDANYNEGSYKDELASRFSKIVLFNEAKKRPVRFEYGFGGHHAWVKQVNNDERLIVVTF